MIAIVVGEGLKSQSIIKSIQDKGIGVTHINTEKHDIIDEKTFKQNGVEHADYLIALTHKDEDNFFMCKLAKSKFSVKKTIALVNHEGNIEFMKSEGIDFVICENLFLSNSIKHFISRGADTCI